MRNLLHLMLLTCTISACSSDAVSSGDLDLVPAQEQKQTLDNNSTQSYILIDVRSNEEYQENGVKQAINLPYNNIDEGNIASVVSDKNTPIKLYCRSGSRAGVAMDTLLKLGYTNVENLQTVDDAREYVKNNPIG